MIVTLFITVLLESIIVVGYCLWRRKPAPPILFTSLFGNVVTQSLLWVVLTLFFQSYLVTLVMAEIFIWVIESALLYLIPANQLRVTDAILLSLAMNLVSFSVGLFLPI